MRYENQGDGKFWEVTRDGSTVALRWGKLGGNSASQSKKTLANEDAAIKHIDKLIAEKTRAGFEPVGGATSKDSKEKSPKETKEAKATKAGKKISVPLSSIHASELGEDEEEEVEEFEESLDGKKAIKVTIEQDENRETFIEKLEAIADDPDGKKLTTLIIGEWGSWDDMEMDINNGGDAEPVVAALCKLAPKLPSLRALWFADTEWQISWLAGGLANPLLRAFPDLEHLKLMGDWGFSHYKKKEKIPPHANLRSLIFETIATSGAFLEQIAEASFPALEYLEVWMGSEERGGDFMAKNLTALGSGKVFPRLKHLGLKNSQFADEIAKAIANAPILERLEVLDLSDGTLSDEGAQALLAAPGLKKLKKLDISHHFVSDELVKQLEKVVKEVDASDGEPDAHEDDRYVACSE